jgi:hypothetical protein
MIEVDPDLKYLKHTGINWSPGREMSARMTTWSISARDN